MLGALHPCHYTGCYFIDRSASPEDDESAQISLYNSVPDIIETANNPQYGDTMKQSDTTANPNSKNENVYSYAIP